MSPVIPRPISISAGREPVAAATCRFSIFRFSVSTAAPGFGEVETYVRAATGLREAGHSVRAGALRAAVEKMAREDNRVAAHRTAAAGEDMKTDRMVIIANSAAMVCTTIGVAGIFGGVLSDPASSWRGDELVFTSSGVAVD